MVVGEGGAVMGGRRAGWPRLLKSPLNPSSDDLPNKVDDEASDVPAQCQAECVQLLAGWQVLVVYVGDEHDAGDDAEQGVDDAVEGQQRVLELAEPVEVEHDQGDRGDDELEPVHHPGHLRMQGTSVSSSSVGVAMQQAGTQQAGVGAGTGGGRRRTHACVNAGSVVGFPVL